MWSGSFHTYTSVQYSLNCNQWESFVYCELECIHVICVLTKSAIHIWLVEFAFSSRQGIWSYESLKAISNDLLYSQVVGYQSNIYKSHNLIYYRFTGKYNENPVGFFLTKLTKLDYRVRRQIIESFYAGFG